MVCDLIRRQLGLAKRQGEATVALVAITIPAVAKQTSGFRLIDLLAEVDLVLFGSLRESADQSGST